MKRTVRDDIRDHYQHQELSPESLARLTAMTEAFEQQPADRGRMAAVLAFAATLLLIAGTSLFWPRADHRSVENGKLAFAVAEEIAMNHNKELTVEYPATDLAELRKAMDKLDFSLVDSERLVSQELSLVGARYCSIQGHLAAQLRLENPSGEIVTLYQTPLVTELADLPTRKLQARGLRIDLWGEDGVLFGMARAP